MLAAVVIFDVVDAPDARRVAARTLADLSLDYNVLAVSAQTAVHHGLDIEHPQNLATLLDADTVLHLTVDAGCQERLSRCGCRATASLRKLSFE
jgi:hypothetical protein